MVNLGILHKKYYPFSHIYHRNKDIILKFAAIKTE